MQKSDYSKGLKVVKIKLVRDGAIGKDRYITSPQEAVGVKSSRNMTASSCVLSICGQTCR